MGQARSGAGDEFYTPRGLVDALGPFDLDPCDNESEWSYQNPTALCRMVLPEELRDGLPLPCSECYCGVHQDWSQFGLVWLNPPFSNVREFLRKLVEHKPGGVALLPAATDTFWFHELVLPYAEVRFIPGRIKFYMPVDGKVLQSQAGITRPLFLAAYGDEAKRRLASLSLVRNKMN